MKRIGILLILIIWSYGCAQNMDTIKRENLELKTKVSQLERRNRELENKLTTCSHLNEILKKEKSYNYRELDSLKSDVRSFLRKEIKEIELLSSKKVLMDYVGGEIIKRDFSQDKDVIYILYGKKFKTGDEIRGVKGYFAGPTRFQLKIFRPIDKKYVCVGQTQIFSVSGKSIKFIPLSSKIVLTNGDVIGFYFPDVSNLFFDKKTGTFGRISGLVKIGEKIPIDSEGNLSVSIGVMGYFQ